MCKKFIIETHENSSSFGILYIYYHNGRDRGFLKYYVVFGEGEIKEVTEIEKDSGWDKLSEKLIAISEKVCEKNDAVLWSY